jgi:hypothetical protein
MASIFGLSSILQPSHGGSIHAYPVKTDTHYILVNDEPFRHPPNGRSWRNVAKGMGAATLYVVDVCLNRIGTVLLRQGKHKHPVLDVSTDSGGGLDGCEKAARFEGRMEQLSDLRLRPDSHVRYLWLFDHQALRWVIPQC